MFAEVRSRADNFGLAHVVVGNEDDLEKVTNVLVIVHNCPNAVDQVNDLLRHPVPWSSLATENGDARELLLPLLGLHGLEGQVTVNDAKDVELLTLVLVDTLDLNIKQGSWVYRNAVCGLDKLRKADLVGVLDLIPLFAEVLIFCKLLNAVQQSKILEEFMAANLGCNELRQSGVGLVKPTTGSDAVGHVGELVRTVNLHKVFEDSCLNEVRVQLSDTVDLVRSDNGQEGHPYHLRLGFLNDGNSPEHVSVLGERLLHRLEEVEIDFIDNLQMSGEEVLHQTNRPLLQSLREDGVVGVAKLGNVRE